MGPFDVNVSVLAYNLTHIYNNHTFFSDVFEVYRLSPPTNTSSVYSSTTITINFSWSTSIENYSIFRPNADGSPVQLTPIGTANNWQCVDEDTHDGATTYAQCSVSVFYYDVYQLQNHTTETGTITRVTANTVLGSPGQSSNRRASFGLKTGGTTWLSDIFDFDYYWTNYSESWELNPTTDVAWTWGDIDDLQTYLFLQSHLPSASGCTQMYITVDYEEVSLVGSNTDSVVIVRSNTSYPICPTDGYEVQNSTADYYNTSVTFDEAYFSLFAYNDTTHSLEWGVLGLNCYNESNPSQAIGFDVEITNSDATETYTASDLANTHYIDINDIPYGDDTIFIITNSSYRLSTYYKDLLINQFYNYSFYLAPIESEGEGGDEGGTGTLRVYTDVESITNPNIDVTITLTHTLDEMISVDVYNISGTYPEWVSVPNNNYTISGNDVIINQSVLSSNTTMAKVTYYYMDYDNTVDTQLYILNVVGPQNEYTSPPVEGAKIIIKRYINTSDSYEEIRSRLTDANGNAEFYLIPDVLLKIFISKDGYDSTVSDYITSASVPTKTFRITPTTTAPPSYDIFWDDITFTGGMFVNGTIKVTYSDSNESTVNTQIYLYDVYADPDTLNDTHSNTGSSSFVYWVAGINTSRNHELWLYFNNTANYASVTSPVVITVFAITWDGPITPNVIEERFESMFGEFELGYFNVIAIIIPIILLCTFGMLNAGLGILTAGVSLGFFQAFFGLNASASFNPLLALVCPIVIAIGFLYLITVKPEENI